jgi:hypothetical protein
VKLDNGGVVSVGHGPVIDSGKFMSAKVGPFPQDTLTMYVAASTSEISLYM